MTIYKVNKIYVTREQFDKYYAQYLVGMLPQGISLEWREAGESPRVSWLRRLWLNLLASRPWFPKRERLD